MQLLYKYSPVYKPVSLIVGIRVNLDGNAKNLGNVYLVLYIKKDTEMVSFSSQNRTASITHFVHSTSNL